MHGAGLTVDQLRKLRAALRRKLGYIRKLRARMLQRQFPETDRMLREAVLAETALHDLLAEIETYLSYKDRTPEPFR